MSPHLIAVVVKAEIFYAAIPGFMFVILYQVRAKWWRTKIGRLMMGFIGSLESILLLTVMSVFWPHMPGRPYLRILVWAIIDAVFTWMLVGFLKADSYRKEFEK